MIYEDYVIFKQAKLLKEKGFPQDTPEYLEVIQPEDKAYLIAINRYREGDEVYFKSTLSLVQKWFIDEWNIHIFPECETDVDSYGNVIGFHYDCTVRDINLSEQICDTYILENYKTADEALSAGIDKALKLI